MLGERFSQIVRMGTLGGNGQFSLMFTATDTRTGQKIALKFFHPEKRNDPYRFASFKREDELLQSLQDDPAIIDSVCGIDEFIDGFDTGFGVRFSVPFAYYAMELAASDLAAVLAYGPFEAATCLKLFKSVCLAVHHLQLRQIVHRDLKPTNVLVMANRTLKLSDLGTSRSLDPSALALLPDYGTFWPGDTRYAAPEMLAGLFAENPNLAMGADFYSLGAILFEMFAGTALFGQVFTPSFAADLFGPMSLVKGSKRRPIFDSFVSGLAASHPLPSLSLLNDQIPRSIRSRVDELYRHLACLDYRNRLCNFAEIFRQIHICLTVIANETIYQRWLAEKRYRRMVKRARMRIIA